MGERIDDEELERALSDIGGRLAYPDSDLWPAVRARIAERRAAPWWSRFGDRRTALAPVLVTLLVMVVALFTLSPELRARAAEALGLGGVQIFRVAETPRPAPSPSASPAGFGRPVQSLAEASAAAGFTVRAPAALGQPDAVYVEPAPGESTSGMRVTLVYTVRAGIPVSPQAGVSALVVEFKGTVEQIVLGKAVGPGTTIESVTVNGGPGFWLAGEPHQFFYRDPSGNFQADTLRLAGNTLLWEEGGITHRLEAQVSKDEALRIASSVR